MSKVDDSKKILSVLGLPPAQQNDRSALTLLALAKMRKRDQWSNAKNPLLRIWDIMSFIRDELGHDYAANTRETIRRQTIHQFEQARLVDRNPDNPKRPTNSGKTVYCLTDDALGVVRLFGTEAFGDAARQFMQKVGGLQARYRAKREINMLAVKIEGGKEIRFSPGAHNALQIAVLREMAPRFAGGAEVLYVGDTAKKNVLLESDVLDELKFPVNEHDKLPDIVLYVREKNWLFLIEAVTTHGPVTPKRHLELESVLRECRAGRVYVSAFPDVATFRKYAGDIAWETEVWIADQSDHMIHFNGPKFVGPYIPSNR